MGCFGSSSRTEDGHRRARAQPNSSPRALAVPWVAYPTCLRNSVLRITLQTTVRQLSARVHRIGQSVAPPPDRSGFPSLPTRSKARCPPSSVLCATSRAAMRRGEPQASRSDRRFVRNATGPRLRRPLVPFPIKPSREPGCGIHRARLRGRRSPGCEPRASQLPELSGMQRARRLRHPSGRHRALPD